MDSRFKDFITQFDSFLKHIAPEGSIITTRQIKRWIRSLDETHPLKAAYAEYTSVPVESIDFDGMACHMKYLQGYYQAVAYHRRVGTGTDTKYITVKQNKIKIA